MTSSFCRPTARSPTLDRIREAGVGRPAHPVTAPVVTFWFRIRKRFFLRGSYAP